MVIGIRAFNVRTDLVSQLPALFAYVKAGGNVIEQYNRPGRDLKTDQLAPYSLHLSSERVTDETAPVTFLAPDHPVLNTPNKITSADFDGWIQERGIYFPDQWDEHFTPILACSDPGEAPLKGGLLVAQYGKGYFVYTGLCFSGNFPPACPALTGCLPIWFRWENEIAGGQRSTRSTGAPRMPAGRIDRPAGVAHLARRLSFCASAASSSGWCCCLR